MLVPVDADYILKQRKKPVAVVTRLRQVLDELQQQKQLSTALHLRLEDSIHHLNECITTCERIRASPIPPLYTSHTGLLLIFYLFSLPLALQGSELMSPVGTILTTAVVGYAMLGLDEISHVLEQPFKLMPLYQISKTSMLDVSDSVVCRPPKLEDVNVDYSKMVAEPTYW
jgi:putative membrane protein